MSRMSRWFTRFGDEWRQRYRDVVDVAAKDALHDSRWNALRSRRARRAIVAVGFVLIVAVTPAFIATWIAGAAVTVGIVVAWALLRRSLREVGDLPARLLDERQLAVRNRAYRTAWKLFMGVFTFALGVCAGVLLDASDFGASPIEVTMSLGAGLGVIAAVAGITALLPYAVLAWLEPGEPGDEPDLRIAREGDPAGR